MFGVKKSDFGIIIGGYGLISFIMMMAAVVYAVYYMNFTSDLIKGFLISSEMSANMMMFIPLVICAILGILAGVAAMLKGYFTDGMLFIATSLVLVTVGGSPFAFAFALIYGIISWMAYKEEALDIMVISILMGIISFLNYFFVLGEARPIVLILAVLSLVVSLFSMYITYNKWAYAQEYIDMFNDSFYDSLNDVFGCDGDCGSCKTCEDCCACDVDGCDCACHDGDECDKEDCKCHCHKGDCRKI